MKKLLTITAATLLTAAPVQAAITEKIILRRAFLVSYAATMRCYVTVGRVTEKRALGLIWKRAEEKQYRDYLNTPNGKQLIGSFYREAIDRKTCDHKGDKTINAWIKQSIPLLKK